MLYGGAGNDTYYIYATDLGQDRIEDKEGNNTVVLNGTPVRFFVKENGQIDYHSPDARFTGRYQGTDFVVSDNQVGNSVMLNANFQDGDFGIHLEDLPPLPVGPTNVGESNTDTDEPPIPATIAGRWAHGLQDRYTDDVLWGDFTPGIGLVSPQYAGVYGLGGDEHFTSLMLAA